MVGYFTPPLCKLILKKSSLCPYVIYFYKLEKLEKTEYDFALHARKGFEIILNVIVKQISFRIATPPHSVAPFIFEILKSFKNVNEVKG